MTFVNSTGSPTPPTTLASLPSPTGTVRSLLILKLGAGCWCMYLGETTPTHGRALFPHVYPLPAGACMGDSGEKGFGVVKATQCPCEFRGHVGPPLSLRSDPFHEWTFQIPFTWTPGPHPACYRPTSTSRLKQKTNPPPCSPSLTCWPHREGDSGFPSPNPQGVAPLTAGSRQRGARQILYSTPFLCPEFTEQLW